MKIIKLSVYEWGQLKRYLENYISMEKRLEKNSGTGKFTQLKYDENYIENILMRRLNGEDYNPSYDLVSKYYEDNPINYFADDNQNEDQNNENDGLLDELLKDKKSKK